MAVQRFRPSTSFLAIVAALLLVLAAYLWLAFVGGCEDYGTGECHPSYGWLFWVPFGLLVAVVGELLRRGFGGPERTRQHRHDLMKRLFMTTAGVAVAAFGAFNLYVGATICEGENCDDWVLPVIITALGVGAVIYAWLLRRE